MINPSPIRVAIFEDNPIVLDAFQAILNGTTGYLCVGAFKSCNNLKHDLQASQPQLILMDIEMPGFNGIEATRRIKQTDPGIRVLIETIFDDEQKIFDALCAGAHGYLLKNTPPVKLLEAITDVYQGGVVFGPAIAAKVVTLFQHFGPSNLAPDYQLTSREKEILQLLTQGYKLPRIADTLFLGYETIRSYVKIIYQKLHVAGATEAVAKALRERLV